MQRMQNIENRRSNSFMIFLCLTIPNYAAYPLQDGLSAKLRKTKVSPWYQEFDNAVRESGLADLLDKDTKLKRHGEDLTLLQLYSEFLQDRGYIDVDWIAEQPTAIDEFMKTRKL